MNLVLSYLHVKPNLTLLCGVQDAVVQRVRIPSGNCRSSRKQPDKRGGNKAAGVDGVLFEDIEASGVEPWLGELADRLKRKDYRPEAVKRVWIPKPNGKLHPLGIPTIIDRVFQTATMLVLEPIFEADLQPEQYRPTGERVGRRRR